MPRLTRRDFLGSAGAAAAFTLLPPSLKNVLAASPPEPLRSLQQIEHVVMLIQENRSFDHYFGSLSGVRGFADKDALGLSTGRSVFYQPDALNPDGYELPFHLDTSKTNAAAIADLSHAWYAQHKAWNGGKMDSWLPAHREADGGNGPLTMGHYTRQDLPFHYALADAFTICDGYHCSVMGPTHPNLIFALTGTNDPDGKGGGPVVDNSWPAQGSFTWTTYPERLLAAGVNWRSYQTDPSAGIQFMFRQYNQAPKTSQLYQAGVQPRPITAFMDDVRSGNLPQVSWLHSNADEHPSGRPAAGALYMYDVLEALASRPDVWAKTVLFITYDENDGFFDHVVPPTPPPGTPGEWITTPLPPAAGGIAGPSGLGFRVPALVISPWSRGGWVCSETFDHTSIIRFMERRFGVMEPNISAWRRSTSGDLTSSLRLGGQDDQFPKLPDPNPMLRLTEQEVGTLPLPTVPAVQGFPAQEPAGAQFVDLSFEVSPLLLPLGAKATVTAVLRNGADDGGQSGAAGTNSETLRKRPAKAEMLTDVAVALGLPAGWSSQATSATTFPRLAPGKSTTVTWQLTAPTDPRSAASAPTLGATYHIRDYQGSILDLVPVIVPVPLAAAFNNAGISDDANQAAANFDGGGTSYSQQGLTGAGLAPGKAAIAGGVQYVMPNVAPAQPDNLLVSGQTIAVPAAPGATALGFMGSGGNGTVSVGATITYIDGSTQTATLAFGDWTLGGGNVPPLSVNSVVAVTPYRNSRNGGSEHVKTYIFATTPVALAAGKTVASVSFPKPATGGQFHIFAIGTDKGPLS